MIARRASRRPAVRRRRPSGEKGSAAPGSFSGATPASYMMNHPPADPRRGGAPAIGGRDAIDGSSCARYFPVDFRSLPVAASAAATPRARVGPSPVAYQCTQYIRGVSSSMWL